MSAPMSEKTHDASPGSEKSHLKIDTGNTPSLASTKSILDDELHPSDCFVAKGDSFVYWADLPAGERRAFALRQQNDQFAKDFGLTWQQFKSDPLLPVTKYFGDYVLPGFGLLCDAAQRRSYLPRSTEGYVLFSIGNLKTLFKSIYPACWGATPTVCNKESVESTDYLGVVGIIIGQACVGLEADSVGRRFGLIQDAVIMLIGAILLTAAKGANNSMQGMIAMYAVAQFVYGTGVGGEYPLTATTSMERSSKARADSSDRLYRGRRTVGAFLLQGQFANQALLLVLLLIFTGGTAVPGEPSGEATYRVSFAFIAVCILWLLYHRIYKQRNADAAINRAKAKQGGSKGSAYDRESAGLALKHFWPRLIGTAGGWWSNDFIFYEIFASTFIPLVSGGSATILSTWLYNLLNVGIALAGYYTSFFLMDSKVFGRRRIQILGFAFNVCIFAAVAGAYPQLSVAGPAAHGLQVLYFMSTYFQQFGSNCVTFLAEVYPVAVRGSAHGMSAAIGKVGALIPTVLYNYISNRNTFVCGAVTGFVGLICTYFFLPDTTGLDLHEQERWWACIRAGRPQDYHGVAIHPRHLSWYEQHVQKLHLNYDAELDRKQRIEEMREAYDREQATIADEKAGELHENDSELSPAMRNFFAIERSQSTEHLLRGNVPEGRLGQARIGDALQ